MVVGYGPTEGDGEERDRFWNDMGRNLDSEGSGYSLCILGDLNSWIGDRTRAGITGAFGVPGENDNSIKAAEFCEERGLGVGNTYFKHRSVPKYTRVAMCQKSVKIKSMIHLVLVKIDMLRYVQDVTTVRGMGRGLSDH